MLKKIISAIAIITTITAITWCSSPKESNIGITEIAIESSSEKEMYSKKYLIEKGTYICGSIDEDTLIVRELNDEDKVVNGIDNVLYKLSVSTNKKEKILETIKKENMFYSTYVFEDEYLVWFEGNNKVSGTRDASNGSYIIGCKNLKSGEIFKIKEWGGDSRVSDKGTAFPQEISYSNNVIAYKYRDIINEELVETIETFNLSNKECKLQYRVKESNNITLSEPQILKGKICFSEALWGGESSKLYYYGIDEEPKPLIEKTKEPYYLIPYLTEDYIYISEFETSKANETLNYSISRIGINDKKEEFILSDQTIVEGLEDTKIDELGGNQLAVKEVQGDRILVSTNIFEQFYYNMKTKRYERINKEDSSMYINKIIKDYLIISHLKEEGDYKEYLVMPNRQ
ncbi:MAG: hypothetical protein ACRC7N_19625 [Clostridium sp.]